MSSGIRSVITAPSADWLKSSHSADAGEKPKLVCSAGADCSRAERELRSAS